MLVLSRKLDEKIMIGDDIVVTLVKMDANRVRIGIDAPKNVRILRGELSADDSSPNGAGTLSGDSSDEYELSDREQAFAHPENKPMATRRTPVGAFAGRRPESKRVESGTRKVFVGKVVVSASQPTLPEGQKKNGSAPLSSFVAT